MGFVNMFLQKSDHVSMLNISWRRCQKTTSGSSIPLPIIFRNFSGLFFCCDIYFFGASNGIFNVLSAIISSNRRKDNGSILFKWYRKVFRLSSNPIKLFIVPRFSPRHSLVSCVIWWHKSMAPFSCWIPYRYPIALILSPRSFIFTARLRPRMLYTPRW